MSKLNNKERYVSGLIKYEKTPWRAFNRQRLDAARRGIEFKFEFDEWVKWWESQLGPDWFKSRGKGGAKYVMARKGDCGPYVSWNVEAKTGSQNIADQKTNGSRADDSLRGSKGAKNPKAKLDDGKILEIRKLINLGISPKIIAIKHGVSFSTIYRIKANKLWGHV